jgi:hypothetical protein
VRVLFVFLDGVGLGEGDVSRNVFVAYPPPALVALLDGQLPVASAAPIVTGKATLRALDACFGMDGIPQSGTGQTALLTGHDAVAAFGRHFGPWVPAALRPLVRDESVLARAKRAGFRVAFANAYPEEIHADEKPDASSRRASRFLTAGPPLAALGAGVLTRHTEALMRGDALASEITNDAWRTRLGRTELPAIDPREAGHNLTRIAAAHDLTLFAHYGTDYAGHKRDMGAAATSLAKVDTFLDGIVESLPDDMLLVVSSDHGNIEDVSAGHTRNPAICLTVGPGHEDVSRDWRSLTDVAGGILGVMGR